MGVPALHTLCILLRTTYATHIEARVFDAMTPVQVVWARCWHLTLGKVIAFLTHFLVPSGSVGIVGTRCAVIGFARAEAARHDEWWTASGGLDGAA